MFAWGSHQRIYYKVTQMRRLYPLFSVGQVANKIHFNIGTLENIRIENRHIISVQLNRAVVFNPSILRLTFIPNTLDKVGNILRWDIIQYTIISSQGSTNF